MNKKLLSVSLATAAIMAGASFYTNSVLASSKSFADHPMVSKIADRFGLNENEVEDFMQEQRETRHTEMEQKFIDKLDEAVASGELTEEQKELILQKHEEMKDSRANQKDNWRDLSPEDKQMMMEERRAKHEEMQSWLDENGISQKYFGLGRGEGMKHKEQGFKVGWGK